MKHPSFTVCASKSHLCVLTSTVDLLSITTINIKQKFSVLINIRSFADVFVGIISVDVFTQRLTLNNQSYEELGYVTCCVIGPIVSF